MTATEITLTERSERINKETWRDWMPKEWPEPAEDQLMTRPEFLRALHYLQGIEMTEANLVEWEQYGLLPRPVRQRHGNAVRVVYPWWIAYLVQVVLNGKHAGKSKAEIKELMQEARSGLKWLVPHWESEAHTRVDQLQTNVLKELWSLLMFYRQRDGIDTATRAAVVIEDNEGNERHQLSFSLDENHNWKEWILNG